MVFSPTACWLMDTRAFYDKFCRDLRFDQKRNDGRVAIYLPNEFPGLTAAVWSDIATFLPQNLYTAYGDTDALRRHYPLMREWVDCVRRQDETRGEISGISDSSLGTGWHWTALPRRADSAGPMSTLFPLYTTLLPPPLWRKLPGCWNYRKQWSMTGLLKISARRF